MTAPHAITSDNLHGITVPDPFRWLEDRTSAKTRQWVARHRLEARLTLNALAGHAHIATEARRLLAAEHVEQFVLGEESVFFLRREGHADQAVLWQRDSVGQERRLLDPMCLDRSGHTALQILAVSADDARVALSLRAGGAQESEIAFLNVNNGVLGDRLPATEYRGLAMTTAGVFYASLDADRWKIRLHEWGTNARVDRTAFQLPDHPLIPYKLGIQPSTDGSSMLVQVTWPGPPRSVDLYLLNADGTSPPLLLLQGSTGYRSGGIHGNQLYYVTVDQDPNGQVMRRALDRSSTEDQVVVAVGTAPVRRLLMTRNRLLVVCFHDGTDQVHVNRFSGESAGRIDIPDPGRITAISTHPKRTEVAFAVESWNQFRRIYVCNAETNATACVWRRPLRQELQDLRLERISCRARDGEDLPLYVMRGASSPQQSCPTLVLAYGGYGTTAAPKLSIRSALWLLHGGQVVVAGIRGGGDRGSDWHRAGSGIHRQKSIDDLIDVADWLAASGRCAASQLAFAGASHAATLGAAAAVQAPDRFAAIVCSAGLMDLVRFEQFSAGRWSAHEIGTTSNPEHFAALLAYSPYHHVRTGVRYPAMLLIAGEEDTLIDPLHIRKFAARIMDAGGAASVILLDEERRGHQGQLPLERRVRMLADQISFLATHTGLTLPNASHMV